MHVVFISQLAIFLLQGNLHCAFIICNNCIDTTNFLHMTVRSSCLILVVWLTNTEHEIVIGDGLYNLFELPGAFVRPNFEQLWN